MSGEALKNYIRNNSLQCESEMDVFRAVVRWLKHDEARKEKATMLMRHVRFGLMSSSSLLGDLEGTHHDRERHLPGDAEEGDPVLLETE